MSTIETLTALQQEIGSRRAGTDGERQAQEWLRSRCQELGLPVELDEFTFIGSELYRPLLRLATMIWATASIVVSFTGQPLIGVIGFLAMFIYLNVIDKRLDVRLARTRSHNVIAGLQQPLSEYVNDPDKKPAMLICAHYDTPRNSPSWLKKLFNLFRFLLPTAILGILVYVVFMILYGISALMGALGLRELRALVEILLPWTGGLVLLMSAPLLLIVLFLSFHTLLAKKTDSPGADDNGSGTAMALELARRFKTNPPQNIQLFFAWWGAEEQGLFGSRQFVRRFHDQLDKETFHVLNLDCVGVGEMLTIYTGQGVFRRRTTHPDTIERLERIASQLGIKTIRTWQSILSGGSSDHAEWVDRGYRQAVPFLRENYRPRSLPTRILAALLRIPDANQLDLEHIHTAEDTIEGINPAVLEETANMAEAYTREIDAAFQGGDAID